MGHAVTHDALCERVTNGGRDCGCGSRACPLCDGCRDGMHTKHATTTRCDCPLCEEEAA